MENMSQAPVQTPVKTLPSVGDLFSSAWLLWKQKIRNAIKLVAISFGLQIVLMLVSVLLGVSAFGGAATISSGNVDLGGPVLGVSILLFAVLIILYLLAYSWIQAAFILYFDKKESTISLSAIFAEAKKFIFSLWWVSLLVGLAVMGGIILLVIPGIIFAIWFCFSSMIVVLEGSKGTDAMKRSKSYVSGRWWGVFGRLIALGLAVGIVNGIANYIFGVFGTTVGSVLSGAFTALCIAPFTIAYTYTLYRGAAGKSWQAIETPSTSVPPVSNVN